MAVPVVFTGSERLLSVPLRARRGDDPDITGRMTSLPPTDPAPRLLKTRVGPLSMTEEGPERAPAALCVHGLPGGQRDFRHLAPLLAADLRVIRLEMPGFGGSPAGSDTLGGWADAVRAAADALDLPRVVLVSHSFGSGAHLLAAPGLGERLAGLALIAPMGLRRHRAFLLPRTVCRVQARLMALPGLRPLLFWAGRQVYRKIGLLPPDDWREVRRHLRILASVDFEALTRAARQVRAPVLLVHARDDRMVEEAIPQELVGVLPEGELLELDGGGHHLQKTRAAEVATAVRLRFGAGGRAR